MSADSWSTVRRLVEDALDLDPGERSDFLARECGGDEELHREVEEILFADSASGDFLEPLRHGEPGDGLRDELEGASIGGFVVRRPIATGGMGTVYEAEQESPRRVVALKVLRSVLPSERELRRFRFETEVLARLRHPAIAQIYEAGTHVLDGDDLRREIPFFAMEYVERARPLVAYAREERLDLRARLALFLQVCEAVQHGHQRGVIHRDLKAGNVLVDAAGRPKVIDFGVARAVGDDSRRATLLTEAGQVVGTLAAMSPEQIAGDRDDVDVRADVWALGVMLYELLSGAPPFRVEDLPLAEAARAVCEDSPSPPGARDPAVPAELDWVCLRALEKDKERRYGSAAELGADLGRFLRNEPVLAGPPTAVYRLRKFVRRHRVLVAAAALVVVSLAVATAVTAAALVESRRERAVAVETLDAFEDVLLSASRDREGRAVRLIDVLDAAGGSLEERFAASPLAGARLMASVGRVYTGLGDLEAAEPLLERALEVLHAERGAEHPDTIAARHGLGVLYRDAARYDEALEHLTAVHEIRRRRLGAEHEDTLAAALDLGLLASYRGEYERADELFEEVRTGPLEDLALDALAETANLRLDQGRPEEGLALLEEAAAESERLRGPEAVATAAAWNGLAIELTNLRRFDEAQELYRRTLAVYREKLGAESHLTQVVLGNLALLLKQRGELGEAERIYREVLEVQERTLDAGHPELLNTLNNLGRLLQARGSLEEAEGFLRRALAGAVASLGELDRQTLMVRNNLGLVLSDLGRLEEAEAELAAALEGRERSLSPDHPDTLKSVNNLAYVCMKLGRDEEAERLFVRSLEGRRARQGASHPDTITALVSLGWFHQDGGRFEEAARWYEEALSVCRAEPEALREVLPLPLGLLTRLRLEQGELDRAQTLADELLELHPEGHPLRARVQALADEVRAALAASDS